MHCKTVSLNIVTWNNKKVFVVDLLNHVPGYMYPGIAGNRGPRDVCTQAYSFVCDDCVHLDWKPCSGRLHTLVPRYPRYVCTRVLESSEGGLTKKFTRKLKVGSLGYDRLLIPGYPGTRKVHWKSHLHMGWACHTERWGISHFATLSELLHSFCPAFARFSTRVPGTLSLFGTHPKNQ
jgi:hypothetical protein